MITPVSKGVILLDIMLALSLAAVFAAAMAETSLGARGIFEHAAEKDALLTAFENHSDESRVSPYESKEVTADLASDPVISGQSPVIKINGGWFGNNRVESIINVSGPAVNILFSAVEAAPPAAYDAPGTPICSIDFVDGDVVGSYEYLDRFVISPQTAIGPSTVLPAIIPVILPIDPLLPLSDIEVRNGTAYISADSSTASDPDLLVLDIRDKDHPTIISSINTGPGISSFSLAGKRIYAAAASTAAQLHIVRFDRLSDPIVESKFRLPLPYATATPPFASSIFYVGGLVYLGTEKWDGGELVIIDAAFPAEPRITGSFEIGSKVNDIFVRGGLAYVAASDQKQLLVVDAADPSNPSETNSFSPSGWERQEGKTLSLFEDGLAFGRTSGGFNIVSDHEIFSWVTTSAASLVSPVSADIPGGAYGVVQDRRREYIATRNIDKEFTVTDRLLSTASKSSYSLPVAPQAITCDNRELYILAHSAPVIYKINFE